MPPASVTLRVERQLLSGGATLVCGVDEVGRGALGGPVSVGVVVVDATVRRSLPGVRDSKLLTPHARTELIPRIQRWAVAYAVGHASAAEIDDLGIIAALRRAGMRALASLPVEPDAVLLDGKHDWLTPPRQDSLFDEPMGAVVPPVTMRIKADLTCASVAAASVLAKVERDAIMADLGLRHPRYGWAGNKGYASPGHLNALQAHGPCEEHRRSWRLPLAGAKEAESSPDGRESATPPGYCDRGWWGSQGPSMVWELGWRITARAGETPRRSSPTLNGKPG
jgi:ribonuclease HII